MKLLSLLFLYQISPEYCSVDEKFSEQVFIGIKFVLVASYIAINYFGRQNKLARFSQIMLDKFLELYLIIVFCILVYFLGTKDMFVLHRFTKRDQNTNFLTLSPKSLKID